jgi:cell surface protein SprA
MGSLLGHTTPLSSVVVTAGGRVLIEGIDYSVNYQLGTVQILDPSLQASNTPINVSLENNSIFWPTNKVLWENVEHKIADNFMALLILKCQSDHIPKNQVLDKSRLITPFWI